MKKLLLSTLFLGLASTAVAADYQLDAFHSNVRFEIDHFNTSTNTGLFKGLTGAMQFDAEKKTGSIDLVIPVKTLQATSPEFTEHLLSADLFNAEKHPEIRFVSTKFNFNNDNKLSSVEGNLSLLGKTHPVTLSAEKFNCYDSPMLNTQVCGGDFTATLDRTQWGMDYLVNVGMSKDVKIVVQVEAAKQ